MSLSRPFHRRTVLGAAGLLGVGLALGAPRWRASAATGWEPPPRPDPATPRPAPVKSKPTLYTTEMRDMAAKNLADGHDWAQRLLTTARAKAAPLLGPAGGTPRPDRGDDWLWSRITSQGLGRASNVHPDILSTPEPEKLTSTYGWFSDPYGRPWKIQHPVTKTWYPTNDFEAFYNGGLDERGEFDLELARATNDGLIAAGQPGNLVNVSYPERGEEWGVDDGTGFVDETGQRFLLAAFYNHWVVWGWNNRTAGGRAQVSAGLQALRDLYLYTGDLAFAHAGIIVLDRIADVYPYLNAGLYQGDGYGGTAGKGRAVNRIWACMMSEILVTAYDAFFPAMADDDPAGVLDFLRNKAIAHNLQAKNTMADIRSNIENNIVRWVQPDVQSAMLLGNFGMHQAAVTTAAVCLDHPADTDAWLDFVMKPGSFYGDNGMGQPAGVSGGDMAVALVSRLDRDGWGWESPGYNEGWINSIKNVVDLFALYPGDASRYDLSKHPKYEQMELARHTLTVLNTFTPALGDTGGVGVPHLLGGTAAAQIFPQAFARYRDRSDIPQRHELAQMAYLKNDNSVDGMNLGMFADGGTIQADIQAVIDSQGPLNLPSALNPGYGAAFFRNGVTGPAAMMYSGGQVSHGHRDALQINMWHHGLDLASPIGYAQYTGTRVHSVGWYYNTVASNTVVVNGSRQDGEFFNPSIPQLWVDTDNVKTVDVDATNVYDGEGHGDTRPKIATRYRRQFTQVMVDADNAYYVDLFRVVGGHEHVYSFHALAHTAEVSGTDMVTQETGTYAGPDVETPPDTTDPGDYNSSGFEFLTNVDRGTPAGSYSVTWPILQPPFTTEQTTSDVRLELTMLAEPNGDAPVADIATADGMVATNRPPNPKGPLRYLLARRSGAPEQTDLASRFVSVLHPYKQDPFLSSAERVDVTLVDGDLAAAEVVAVKVTLADGRTDYIVSSLRPDVTVRVDDAFIFSGTFAVIRLAANGDAVEWSVSAGSARLVPLAATGRQIIRTMSGTTPEVTGVVAGHSTELHNLSEISITLDSGPRLTDPASLVGHHVYVANDGVRNATYEIREATVSGATLTLMVRGTLVRDFETDAEGNPDLERYVYDVAVGQRARIPIIRQWPI
ncbi:heparinase II/III domain-containing protein [Microlunatus sp. Y2014]|uniref:heparinase II/III domain-containing protein n=1 Tax=Microlunatus sp. Y2014 TaxID=3418488 RepID=UPI003DA77058